MYCGLNAPSACHFVTMPHRLASLNQDCQTHNYKKANQCWRARSSSGQHQQHRIMHCGLRADLLRCDGCREAGPAEPQHSRVHDSVSKGCTVALAEPPQKKQSGRSNDWGDEEQSSSLPAAGAVRQPSSPARRAPRAWLPSSMTTARSTCSCSRCSACTSPQCVASFGANRVPKTSVG